MQNYKICILAHGTDDDIATALKTHLQSAFKHSKQISLHVSQILAGQALETALTYDFIAYLISASFLNDENLTNLVKNNGHKIFIPIYAKYCEYDIFLGNTQIVPQNPIKDAHNDEAFKKVVNEINSVFCYYDKENNLLKETKKDTNIDGNTLTSPLKMPILLEQNTKNNNIENFLAMNQDKYNLNPNEVPLTIYFFSQRCCNLKEMSNCLRLDKKKPNDKVKIIQSVKGIIKCIEEIETVLKNTQCDEFDPTLLQIRNSKNTIENIRNCPLEIVYRDALYRSVRGIIEAIHDEFGYIEN